VALFAPDGQTKQLWTDQVMFSIGRENFLVYLALVVISGTTVIS